MTATLTLERNLQNLMNGLQTKIPVEVEEMTSIHSLIEMTSIHSPMEMTGVPSLIEMTSIHSPMEMTGTHSLMDEDYQTGLPSLKQRLKLKVNSQ
jgi:hypothetical protein